MFSTLKVFTKVVLCRAIFANRLFFFDKTKLTLLQARKRWKINVMKGARGFHTNKSSKERKGKKKRKITDTSQQQVRSCHAFSMCTFQV